MYVTKYSRSGRVLASGSFDRTVRLWDPMVNTEVALLSGHELNVMDISWSHDSQALASGSFDKTVRIWSTEVDLLASAALPAAHRPSAFRSK